jgi:hypothetical protein
VPLTHLELRDERRYGSTLLMFYTLKDEQIIDEDTKNED